MSYDVHPVADLFPMLADDELAELAEDIRQRGLLHSIVLDAQGRVLDGRNRLAACTLAGVEPTFITYEGDDPTGYALASNGQVRELTKSQKAVVGARLLISSSDSELEDQQVAAALRVKKSALSEALVIARHPDLADRVLASTLPFSTALQDARERDRRAAEELASKERLRFGALDLLSLVDEERMSLSDAIALLDAREERARQEEDARVREERERDQAELDRRHRHSRSFGESLAALWSFLNPDPAAFVEKTWLADANPHRTTPGAKDAFTEKGLRLLSTRLDALADHVNKHGGIL